MTHSSHSSPYGYKKLLAYRKAEALQSACAASPAHFTHSSHKTLSALADQMDRSARSVKQNIVEGWKRNSTSEYHQFLGFSLGANAELEEDCDDILKGRYEMGGKGLKGEKGAHSTPWSLDEVERLPFYPLDPHLPPLVQLKLRCKELNFLLKKLQDSLVDKMQADNVMPLVERHKQARIREAQNDVWLVAENAKLVQGGKREERGGMGQGEKEERETMGEKGFVRRDTLATLAALLILSSALLVHPYAVTGGSMEPTYREGDVVVIEKLTPHFFIRRGDIIVIKNPHDHSIIEIKRVAGLPNEDVTIGQNNVTVMYPDGHAETFGPDTAIGRGQTGFFQMKLGPEDYLVLGDNRSKSSDSREFGAVQMSDIIGRVLFSL